MKREDMLLEIAESGLVEDFAVGDGTLEVARAGDTRFRFQIAGPHPLVIELWTKRKGTIRAESRDEPPSWVTVERGRPDELVSLRAESCEIHLEQLDRDTYALTLDRGSEQWRLVLRGYGYLKTRVLPAG
jgi:hypothetical protein